MLLAAGILRGAPVWLLWGFVLATLLPVPGSAEDSAQESVEQARTLRIGSISSSIPDELSDFQPFADYLGGRLQGHGIRGGRVVVARDIQAMVRLVAAGEVDVYVDSPFPVAEVARQTGLRPLLRRWKRGVSSYRSLLFVRSDSPVQSLADLRGRRVAFDDPHSTSGYLLPRAMLQTQGLRLVEMRSAAQAVDPETVGFAFSNDDENTLLWVHKGRADAGAIDDGHFESLLRNRVTNFRVIGRSAEVPRHVLAVAPGIDPELSRELEQLLLAMHEDPKGAAVLADFHGTTRFDRFPEGAEAAMERVVGLMDASAPSIPRTGNR